jgi:hypothetical protein
MNISGILQIIKEEIENWFDDEPSMADKYYEKLTGSAAQQPSKPEEPQIDGEKVGLVTTMWGKPLSPKIPPIPIYKNPRSLNGFESYARGVLLADGTFYLALNDKALHDDLLGVLAKIGVIPYAKTFEYFHNYPSEFIAVQRVFHLNKFAQSSAYDEFPFYYGQTFEEANKKHSAYKFAAYNY